MCISLAMHLVQVAVLWGLALFWASLVIARLVVFSILKCKPFWITKERDPPPTLSDQQWGTHKYIQLKNIKIHYVEKGDDSKPLMLFVHGFPEFWYSWRYQMREFSRDYWTVALDMRGYGDSDKPSATQQYEMKHLVGDIKELVNALGRKKFILVAHDWGGVVAWQFLFRYPEMVERYIIMDAPHPRGFRKYMFSNLRQLLMSWYIFFFQVPYIPEMALRSNDLTTFKDMFRQHRIKDFKVTDEDIEAFKYTFGKKGAFTGPINYYRANLGAKQEIQTGSEKRLPHGLFICGEKDDFLSLELLAKVQKYVQNCVLEVIPGANHFVQQDDPDAVNAAMKNFLQI